jgi:hypothetical protein
VNCIKDSVLTEQVFTQDLAMQGKSDQSNNREGKSPIFFALRCKRNLGTVLQIERKEIELAKTELRADIRSEVAMLSAWDSLRSGATNHEHASGYSDSCSLEILPGWAAGLIVTEFFCCSVPLWQLSPEKLVKVPLKRTREVRREI